MIQSLFKPSSRALNPRGSGFSVIFLQELGRALHPLHPTRATIFGSSVKLGMLARDLDLLVLSEKFSHVFWRDRFNMVSLPIGPSYDIRPFSPREFELFYPPDTPFRESI